jgi:selenide, water dikinase
MTINRPKDSSSEFSANSGSEISKDRKNDLQASAQNISGKEPAKSGAKNPTKLTTNVKAAGCAAKMSSHELKQILAGLPKVHDPNLLSSITNFEDAAVYKLNDEQAVIQTVDFFPPVVDDPYLFGQIAATNALSDIYAMGGTPLLALAIFSFPTCDFPLSIAAEILRGGADQVVRAGAMVVGGHSIQGSETLYGLAVTGLIPPGAMLTNGGAKPGDAIVMTKALGTGVSLLALKAELLTDDERAMLFSSLTTLNNRPLAVLKGIDLHACTDITGFGLIGHVHEMTKASKLAAAIKVSALRFLPSCLELAREGLVPAGSYGNRKSFESNVSYINDLPLEVSDLLYDPQTAGGLLFAVAPGDLEEVLRKLHSDRIEASHIGQFLEGIPGHIDIMVN